MFDRPINIEHKQIPKKILKGFLVFACADIYFFLKKKFSTSLKFGPNLQFLYFKTTLSAIFIAIATVKFK